MMEWFSRNQNFFLIIQVYCSWIEADGEKSDKEASNSNHTKRKWQHVSITLGDELLIEVIFVA